MQENMENERGSLNDRLQGFNQEPRPEMLDLLQKNLADKKWKRYPFWLFFAAALVTGSLVIPFYLMETFKKEPSIVHQTKLNPAQSPGKESANTQPSSLSTAQSDQSNQPSTQNSKQDISSSKSNPGSAANEDIDPVETLASEEINQSQPLDHSPTRKDIATPFSNKKKKRTTQVGNETTATPETSLVPARETNPSVTKQEKEAGRKALVFNPLKKRTRKISYPEAKEALVKNSSRASKQNTPSYAIQSSALSEINQENQTNQERDELTHRQEKKKISGEQPPSLPTESRKENVTNGETSNVTGSKETGKEVERSNPEPDSLKKKEIAAENPAKTDSLVPPPLEKKDKKSRFSVTTSLASRYSAVRYLSINQNETELRSQLKDESSPFPARFSFELSNRLNFQWKRKLGFYGTLILGWLKEELNLATFDNNPSGYVKKVQGNSLVVDPILAINEEKISATVAYGATSMGFQWQIAPALPLVRLGGGVQWALWSNLKRTGVLEGNSKMEGAAKAVPFLQAGLVKTKKMGNGMEFSVEPMVQYYLDPTVRFKKGTDLKTLQFGLGIGLTW